MRCPRCLNELGRRERDREGGYRSNVTVRSEHGCPRCGITAMSGANVEVDRKRPPTPLRRTPLVSQRKQSLWSCTTCNVPLLSLRLEWDTRHVVVEACERCDVLFLDRGELDTVEAMVAESTPLRTANLAAIPPKTPVDKDDLTAMQHPIGRWLRRLGIG